MSGAREMSLSAAIAVVSVAVVSMAALPAVAMASPPSIESESVSRVTPTDATLEAGLDTEGVEPHGTSEALTQYQFQLIGPGGTFASTFMCPSEAFPARTSLCLTLGNEVGALPINDVLGESTANLVTRDVAGAYSVSSADHRVLAPNTTYHYRVIAATAIFTVDTIDWEPPVVYGPVETFTTPPEVEKAEYRWALSGSLTDAKLGQAITLPARSTFDGSGELNPSTGKGAVSGSLSIPPFTATVKLFGLLPLSFGMNIAEASPLEGSVTPSTTAPGEEALAIPAKLDVGITSVGLFGLTLPLGCTSTEPVALSLADELSAEALLETGWAFSGSTGLPPFHCEGGFLGHIFGAVLTALLSGPENQYSLSVAPPSG